MIDNLRKYTGLIVVVLVLLFLGLVFFAKNANSNQGHQTGEPVIQIDGKTFLDSEYQRLGPNSMRLAAQLRLYGMFEQLGGGYFNPDPDLFFANRIILRDAAEEFGIYPSDAAISTFLRERSAFTSQDGTFQTELFANFISSIGRLGMTEADVRALVADQLALEQLSPLVGGGLLADLHATGRLYDSDRQLLTVSTATLQAEPFRASLQPTDDDLRAFWQKSKASYLTEPAIKVTYFLVGQPGSPEKKPEEAKEAKPDPAKQAADRALSEQVDNFIVELDKTRGSGFEESAKKNGWEIKTTDFFTRSNIPADLALEMRGHAGETAADRLFAMSPGSDPLTAFSDALPVGERQWLVARIDQSQPAREMTYDEAKDKVRARFIDTEANKLVLEKAKQVQAELAKALANKTALAEAAKPLNLEFKSFGPFARNQPPTGAPASDRLFEVAQDLAPGTLADPVDLGGQVVLVFVEARQAERLPNAEAQLNATAGRLTNLHERAAFQGWLTQRRNAGNYKILKPH